MLKNVIVVLLVLTHSSYAFTLKEGFLKTLSNDPEVQVRANELKKIKYDIDIANGMMYPTLDLRGSLTNTRTSQDSYTPKNSELLSTDEYSLNVNQPLYDGFESAYEKRLQENRYESAQYFLKEAKNSLALTYAQNYINVLKTKDMLSLSSESYQMSEDIYNKTVRKVERGFGTKLEFERAKGNLEESNVNLVIDRLSYNDAVQTLNNHVQETFDSTELVKPTFSYNLPHSENEALQYALSNHPSMLVSLKNVEVAISEQKRELKSFHPDVNLVGQYKLNDAKHKERGVDVSNEYQVGIEIAYNLYNGGRDDASDRKLLQTVKEKKILIQKSNQEISNRLALAWNAYELNSEKLNRLQDFVKTREYVLDTTFKEFDLGTKDLGSVIDAHLDFVSTKRTLVSTTYDLLIAHFRVLEAIGILSDEILSDKREEIWGKNRSNIEEVVKNNTKELVFSYDTLQEEQLKKEEPTLEYLDIAVEKQKPNPDDFIVESEEATAVEPKEEEKNDLSSPPFKQRFLAASPDKYTINLATHSSRQTSEAYIEKHGIQKSAFSFIFGEDEQFYKVMYGVFDSYEQAKQGVKNLSEILQSNAPRVEKITVKQNLYKKYNEPQAQNVQNELVQALEETIAVENSENKQINDVKPVPKEELVIPKEMTPVEVRTESFQQRFLTAPEDSYTINLATFSTMKASQKYINMNAIENSAFSFEFGEEEQFYKVMYGVFENYTQAKNAVKDLSKELRENNPRVEQIFIKQNLYKKYNEK